MSQNAIALPTSGTLTGLALVQDVNAALGSLSTLFSGPSAPTAGGLGVSSLAGIPWHDTTANALKIRNQADTAWITVGTFDETNGAFLPSGGNYWGGTSTNATNAYSVSPVPAATAYAAGQVVRFIVNAANTGAATLNVNGLGAKSITKNGTTALASGDMPINSIATVTYDGTQFQLLGVASAAFTGGSLTSAINEAQGSNIASASTTNIGAATGNYVHITGTTTIAAFDTVQAGTERTLVFDGALTLTHNATSLILPGGASITTAAGDRATFRSEGAGNWRCIDYVVAAALPMPKTGGSFSGAVNMAQGADIASATTTDIGAATGNYLVVTGTTTITGLGTVQAGTQRKVKFAGALTLTHNATSLILPGGASIMTAAGDQAEFVSLGSGNWVCTSYVKASGLAIVSAGSAMQFVASTGVGTGATFDVTGLTSGYDYLFELDNVYPSADDNLVMRYQTGGSTWQTTSYEWVADYSQYSTNTTPDVVNCDESSSANGSTGTTGYFAPLGIRTSLKTAGSSTRGGIRGSLYLTNPGATGNYIGFTSSFINADASSGGIRRLDSAGDRAATGAVTGLRMLWYNGSNFAGGTVNVYKIAKV